MQLLEPKILGWWTKLLRESSQLSQEALAAAAGLTPRTIQRIESGEASSVTTRRSLARGLGYEDIKTFENPETVAKILQFRAEMDRMSKEAAAAQFPDMVRMPATRLKSGQELGHLVESSNACNFHYDDALDKGVKEIAAEMFDYLRDYADMDEFYSEVEKLGVYKQLDDYLRQLQDAGVILHSALRHTKVVGQNWEKKTPLAMAIAYLVIDRGEKDIQEILAAKRFQFG